MRISYFIILSILIIACGGKETKNNKQAILELIQAQQAAWNKGDIDGFMKGYEASDSLKFISSRGVNYGYDSVTASYKRHYKNAQEMGQLSFTDIEIKAIDDKQTVYNALGKWKIQGERPLNGYFSLILAKKGELWKIKIDHTW